MAEFFLLSSASSSRRRDEVEGRSRPESGPELRLHRSLFGRRLAWWLVVACSLLEAIVNTQAAPASFYAKHLTDPRAVYLPEPNGTNDTQVLQQAIDQVQESQGQGIVFVPSGRFQITDTIRIWPSIRVIGVGESRPVFVLPPRTAGFDDASREKLLFHFAGGRPRSERDRAVTSQSENRIPDANPGTFYSALANLNIEVGEGNAGAVAVRAHYAQHCFLAHMDIHVGPGLAGVHEAGNVLEDVRFFGGRYGIWTSRPSPGWPLTLIDCSFQGQREAGVFEREAGLTLIRPHFRNLPSAVAVESGWADELWVKDAELAAISGPAFVFGVENNPRNEINFEGVTCTDVPVFARLRDSGREFAGPGERYFVDHFSHGLRISPEGVPAHMTNEFQVVPLDRISMAPVSDLPDLPTAETWVNLRDLGAKGDGHTDDTAVLQDAIARHRAIYLPMGYYVVHETLLLRPDTVLIGLHPGATQIILPDGSPAFQGVGAPKALLEAPRGGSNIVVGIGLYTSGANPRAVAALWKAGANSLMNDVRFLGGHGTPKPDGSWEQPYNANHTADPQPNRHWDSQYPSLWITDGGGGTFLDIWTPSTFAQAGLRVSDTESEGRVYQISSEHHVRAEVQVRRAGHWRFYGLQTEGERGESAFDLPLEIDQSHDITVANFPIYRVISSDQPFPCAIRVSRSRDVHFRNLHCYSNSKVSYDATVVDQAKQIEVRQREFAWLDIAGTEGVEPTVPACPLVAAGARLKKLADGFFNISGGTVGPNGEFYFVDAHWQRVWCWDPTQNQLSLVSDAPLAPVNLASDREGNLFVVSSLGKGVVYRLNPTTHFTTVLESAPVQSRAGRVFYLPVSDWRLNRESLANPAGQFTSPDGSMFLPVGADFLAGATSWGVKSSPPIRSFSLAPVRGGEPFYLTDEATLTTWKAKVNPDGSLAEFILFAEQGGEGTAVDARDHVFIAAGQVEAYDSDGRWLGSFPVPERPTQIAFGGPHRDLLYITARTSLYAVRMEFPGRSVW